MNNSRKCALYSGILLAMAALFLPGRGNAATWTPLANPFPDAPSTMILLTDGTVMVHSYLGGQSWMRLTPDENGSYANGVWNLNPIPPMRIPRLYFASQVLPDGRLWVLGGEYSGPLLDFSWTPTGEIYDPIANSWSDIAPYPGQTNGCPGLTITYFANTTMGSNVISGILTTDQFQPGWQVSGTGIPADTTITSVDSGSQVHISNHATATGTGVPLQFQGVARACFGDVPSILIPGGKILAGNLSNNNAFIYTVATDSWSRAASKIYSDQSDEESWVKLAGGKILTYDIFQSVNAQSGYAELYDPAANLWTGISPADGTAGGTLPLLSSFDLGAELGPGLRLQDGRVLVIGANQHTALYAPATNTWSAGPDLIGTLNGRPAPFGADDAPAAILPNGHVLIAADAGPSSVKSKGNTTAGSTIITDIPSTALLQPGWSVQQTTLTNPLIIPFNTVITSVDSPTQIHISNPATATAIGLGITFGGTFSNPTQLFDFNPQSGTISPATPVLPDPFLDEPAFVTRMLVLPTGQVLFSDSSTQLWIYTPDGPPNPKLRPVVNQVSYKGHGVFTVTGKQLNGQSAGSSYGDDVQTDENYPIVRLVNAFGKVSYARTTNWSTVDVGGGNMVETVNFTLNPALVAGNYSLIVSGAGISSFPMSVSVTQGEVNRQ
jgi:hypothetical protein